MKSKKIYIPLAASLAVIVACGGCDNSAQSGTLIGAGIGALAGQAIGGDTTGTLVGAGVGAMSGYIIGNEKDKREGR
ncbi:MAG: glycine zipper 2TM domain-containing protein [Planctomycetes bacterium]|nr:glycine zipper 2TM domain-containing protein [Planctomycetota bacterium]